MDSGLVISPTTEGDLEKARPHIEKFGRYFLLDRIAVGGMAEVHRAVTQGVEGFRRTFVVKRILADKASSPIFIRMFCDEARISALLHHPNIVQVYDFGHVAGSYFLAMEYLPGKDLSSLMRFLRAAKASVPPGLAAYVAREAAFGLHHAHALRGAGGQPLGIVHRDVTPSNIMLLYAGGVKLLDFGIAKATAAAGAAPEGEGVKGKFGYLSPEQARGADVDGRADVFALGVTLWEMLVGRRLFAGKDEVETLRNVLQKPVPPPSLLRSEIPPALDRIVLRALERSRERRYATAEEMARDCDGVLGTLRADSQTLRAFLNDLFAEESSSLSLDMPELPDELLAELHSAPVASSSAVPRDDQSLEIEVIDISGPHGRTRTPAPPFGVIATDASGFGAERPSSLGRRVRVVACAVLAASLLLAFGIARQGHRNPSRAAAAPAPVIVVAPAARAASPRAVIAGTAAPRPVLSTITASGHVAAPNAGAGSPAAPTRAKSSESVEAADRKTRGHHRAARAHELSTDLTLNPF
ncbi:MAG TPA: serine/threonine-protein kinase [Polyangia bacterium]